MKIKYKNKHWLLGCSFDHFIDRLLLKKNWPVKNEAKWKNK